MRLNSFTDKNEEALLNPNARIRAEFVFSLLWQNRLISICAFFSALMIALCDLLSIALIVPLIDSLRGGDKASEMLNQLGLNSLATGLNTMSILAKVRIVMITFFVSQLIKSIFGYFVLILATRIEVNVDKNLKTTILNVLFSRSFQQIEKKSVGSHFTLLYNYSHDTSFAARDLIGILPHVPTLIFYIITMLWLSWQLTISSLICAGLIVYGIGYLNKALKDTGINVNEAYTRLNQSLYEILSAMKLIRLFNREPHFNKLFNNHVSNLSHYKVRRGHLQALISPLYNTLIALVLCITFIGASFIYPTDDTEWIQSALLLLIILFRLSTPVNAINERRARLISWGPSLDNIIHFFNHKDRNIQKEGTNKFINLNNDISFENVSFKYSETTPHILKNVSFKIPKGKTTAIVGASGAGKSTLANLVARLYNPTKGTIEADSINISDFTFQSWHSQIGVVSQSTYLFNETIEYNVKFGKLDATLDEIKIACKQANADEFIQGMENEYQTVVGDNGIRLSGGQAQRIAIARAIISDPDIIILDEATSSLDTESELLVQKAIEEIGKHKTVLCIAHRLSTIINADNILVLENGEIVEQGTYSYLIEKRGYFWQYAKLQNLN